MSSADVEKKKKEQAEALEQLNGMLDQTRPKNLGQGLTSGVSNIVGGALGAVGVAIAAPMLGGAMGLRGGGILGGVVGLAGGAVVGAVGAVAVAVGGTVMGVTQVVRGVSATPEAITAPSKGKWWDDNQGKWIYTNLEEEASALLDKGVPLDDSDLLEEIEKDIDFKASIAGGTVQDPYYYQILEVDPKADPAAIKRKYYVLARQYHPDKVDKDDREAADKFKDIAEAYQVLSDPELRAKYDKDGRDGLSADKTEVADKVPKVDPTILFAFLFGSDKFDDYVGRMATATSASVGDSSSVSMSVAREIQQRRVTRLAIKLAAKLQAWVDEDYDMCKTLWKTEAEELSTASYGLEMVHTIGKIYNLAATVNLASLDSGRGFPSISKWATKQKAKMEAGSDAQKNKMETLKAGMEMMKIKGELEKQYNEAKTEEEKKAVELKMEEATGTSLLKILWYTSVVDITNTLYTTCQMVCNDQSVDRTSREKRGHGLKALGAIWMECPVPEGSSEAEKDAKKLYEEAAFAAMLETIKRKEEAAQAAS